MTARTKWLASVLIGTALALGGWFYLYLNPPDRVRISITNIPRGVDHASLAADLAGELRALDWSPKMIVSTAMHPARCIWSSQNPESPKVDWDAYVRWRPAERYGVVTRTTDGLWSITWFDASELPVRRRLPVLGGGEVAFDVAKGRNEPLTSEQVRTLGLQPVEERAREQNP
jgi:hypothetical protein